MKTAEIKLPFSSRLRWAPPVPFQTWPNKAMHNSTNDMLQIREDVSIMYYSCWNRLFRRTESGCVLMPFGRIKMTKWHACYLIGSVFELVQKLAIASGCHLSASLSLCCPNRKVEIKHRKLLSRGVFAASDWLAALAVIIVLWSYWLVSANGQ